MDFNDLANEVECFPCYPETVFPKGSREPVIIHFLKPPLWSRVNPGSPARSSLSVSLPSTVMLTKPLHFLWSQVLNSCI